VSSSGLRPCCRHRISKKTFSAQAEQLFVQQVIHTERICCNHGDKDKERSQELQARWKEAMDALRNSHLKKMGNPLYVLPCIS